METPPYGRISAAVVPVETVAPGNGPALSLPTPPETPHHISATVVLSGPIIHQPRGAQLCAPVFSPNRIGSCVPRLRHGTPFGISSGIKREIPAGVSEQNWLLSLYDAKEKVEF